MMHNPAILFEPDAYLLSESRLMGRQAAGNSFLRAAIAGRHDQPLFAYTPHQRSADVFSQLVNRIEPTATTQWIPADRLDLLSQIGSLYIPGPGLDAATKLRLRAGSAAYSVVGVTHTTASHRAMEAITGLITAPVMPWDALICTSNAVLETVKLLLNAEIETLRWRFGSQLQITLPQLPVIPLGIHCDDFNFSSKERMTARTALNISEHEIVLIFVGRLSFHAKAHPHAMYMAAQEVAKKTGKKITLLQCGWFGNDAIKSSFIEGAAEYAPDVRALFVDGRDPVLASQSWSSADIFISLSDNIQETFGLTPIEAMAAGLPVIVSDWNGYKESIQEGVEGFKIPTFMPPSNLGSHFSGMYEAGTVTYDVYCGLTCQTVSMSIKAVVEKLSLLVENAELRHKMGQAGKERARVQFDWRIVYAQYQNLYEQLKNLRLSAVQHEFWQKQLQSAPKVSASRLDPFYSFGHYPTALIQPQSQVMLHNVDALEVYFSLIKHPLFNYAGQVLPSVATVEKIVMTLNEGALNLQELSEQGELDLGATVLAISVLAKMDLVRLI